MRDHSPSALKAARTLRRDMSLPESMLWRQLRGKPQGVKFRKQHPLGRYVLDFYCAEKRVAVEVDGKSHEMGNRPKRDAHRDSWLREQGVEIVRIPAREVLQDVAKTAENIIRYCADRPPPSGAGAPATSPERGGS